MQYWQSLGFHGTGIASFVDNLLAASDDAASAIRIQDDCAKHLGLRWNLHIGEDSREYLVCKNGHDNVSSAWAWSKTSSMKALGHIIDDDGGFSSCFKATIAAMLRAFFGNLDKGLKRASERAKFRFLNSCMLSVARYRFPRWPFQVSRAHAIDRLQRKLLAIIFDIRPTADESWELFSLRRKARTQALARKCGLWSKAWASALNTWNAHLERGHDKQAWTPQLLGFRDSLWLSLQRLWSSHGAESRLGTRVVQGRPSPRWQESLAVSRSFL